jgi:hypothetical protein
MAREPEGSPCRRRIPAFAVVSDAHGVTSGSFVLHDFIFVQHQINALATLTAKPFEARSGFQLEAGYLDRQAAEIAKAGLLVHGMLPSVQMASGCGLTKIQAKLISDARPIQWPRVFERLGGMYGRVSGS